MSNSNEEQGNSACEVDTTVTVPNTPVNATETTVMEPSLSPVQEASEGAGNPEQNRSAERASEAERESKTTNAVTVQPEAVDVAVPAEESERGFYSRVTSVNESRAKKEINILDNDDSDKVFAQIIPDLLRAEGDDKLYCDPDEKFVTVEYNRVKKQRYVKSYDSASALAALLDKYCIFRVQVGNKMKTQLLPSHWASVYAMHARYKRGFPPLRRVSKNPSLCTTLKRIDAPGYNAVTQIYYDGNPITPRTDGKTPCLDLVLSGWTGMCGSPYRSCATDTDIANLFGAFFTEVLADSGLFTIHRHPLLKGNKKGVGKDLLSECLGILRDGTTPVDLNHDEKVRINQGVGNGILKGRRIFMIANIDDTCGGYKNPMLTRWLTEEVIEAAKHGYGNWGLDPNNMTVIFAINEGKIDVDLADRLLQINLIVNGDARVRDFKGFSPPKYTREHRDEIYGEVMGLAISCLDDNSWWDIPAGYDRRFARWMEVIGGLLARRGLTGFMKPTEDEQNDTEEGSSELLELLSRMHREFKGLKFHANDVVSLCTDQSGVLFPQHLVGGRPDRALSTNVLSRIENQTYALPLAYEADKSVKITLKKGLDKKSKSSCFWLETREVQIGSEVAEATACASASVTVNSENGTVEQTEVTSAEG